MRRVFIAFGFVAFLAYCWASVAYQNQVQVPRYRLVSVDILGEGRTRIQWDADRQAQFQRLMRLENAKYQLPEDARASSPSGSGDDGQGGFISPGRPLDSDDYSRMIARLGPYDGLVMELRDTSAIHALAARDYLLRDPVIRPGSPPDAAPLFNSALPVDKDLIDALLENGIDAVTVTGRAPPVDFEAGTSLMVAVIFLTLTAALKPVLWDPFRTMLDKRRRELQAGIEAARLNQVEEARLEEATRNANAKLFHDIDVLRASQQGEITRLADEIVRDAHNEEKQAKLDGLRRLGDSADAAEKLLHGDIPGLAEAIAEALTPSGAAGDDEKPD
ncbi:MAG: ATP synthase F0 subunit B [Planctomycetota bacterium]|nr:ATP synthase F0 subunit B [Planctomycetota bacterium]